jgi:hypothetical protein
VPAQHRITIRFRLPSGTELAAVHVSRDVSVAQVRRYLADATAAKLTALAPPLVEVWGLRCLPATGASQSAMSQYWNAVPYNDTHPQYKLALVNGKANSPGP